MRFEVGGIGLEGFLEFGDGFGTALLSAEDDGVVDLRVEIVGTEFQRLLELDFGVGEFSLR